VAEDAARRAQLKGPAGELDPQVPGVCALAGSAVK
jgi:hypothetical protein